MRRVAVVTGTRAEYGLLASSMREIEAHADLELRTVVTGMHLSPRHGMTVDEIEADGFAVDDRVHMQVDGDTGLTMAKSLGLGLSGLAESFGRLDPDVVLVLGDRDEAFAAGVAAAHMNVPVAHVHGGDSMDGAIIDDSIRHALTKFAHLHFPVSERSAERVERLGEEPWRITTVGAPGLDAVLTGEYTPPEEVREEYGLDPDRPLALVVQHPVTTQPEAAGDQMRATLDVVDAVDDLQVVLVYPNADAGGQRAIDVIESHPVRDHALTVRSLPRRDFLGVMAAADVMVGNSSSGIIEAPSFGLPVVDVGPRQSGRERAENVVSVPHDERRIREAIDRCLTDDAVSARAASCDNPYDYGGAGARIVARLADVDLDDRLHRKRLTY
ncbi:UDP-N-acetylglucosamine 2-epimerase [Salinigranum salinum]|uniref:UDP-N-acetylglucosamine 2-epimerase n=1 Tax=Salinigranum salinum TaxID=1364937 RepID=UPI0012612A07|nr:UDP-N-acetylglucosamine 2-epimerase [Salinigranum salinum]